MTLKNPTHEEHQRRLDYCRQSNPDSLNWDGPRPKEMDLNHTGVLLGDPRRCRRRECVHLLDPVLIAEGYSMHPSCEFPELFPGSKRRGRR